MNGIKLEICVDTIEGAEIAADAGADRIELCSALGVGGLTPSFGLMQAAAALPVPSYAMIRPRAGNFTYSEAEAEIMKSDIVAAGEAGLAGVVIGAVTPEGALDKRTLASLLKTPLKATLHRAFDVVADPFAALEDAIALGFERILTSGQKNKAPDGVGLIAELVVAAGSRISIMPGGGLNATNVGGVIARTGVREVHASCAAPVQSGAKRLIDLGFEPAQGHRMTIAALIKDMARAFNRLQEIKA